MSSTISSEDTEYFNRHRPGGVHAEFLVELEHVGALGLVVDLAAALALLLRDDLAQILRDQLVLVRLLAQETAPARDVAGSHVQLLAELTLQYFIIENDIITSDKHTFCLYPCPPGS